jgi:hypothetical protein
LTAIDPNGNFQDIGTVTSDINGIFKKMWQPPVTGEYVVTATFDGSKAYGGSHAESTFGVEETQKLQPSVVSQSTNPQPTTTITATPQPTITQTASSPILAEAPTASAASTTTYIVISAAVVALAIIVVVAIALKRRK